MTDRRTSDDWVRASRPSLLRVGFSACHRRLGREGGQQGLRRVDMSALARRQEEEGDGAQEQDLLDAAPTSSTLTSMVPPWTRPSLHTKTLQDLR